MKAIFSWINDEIWGDKGFCVRNYDTQEQCQHCKSPKSLISCFYIVIAVVDAFCCCCIEYIRYHRHYYFCRIMLNKIT